MFKYANKNYSKNVIGNVFKNANEQQFKHIDDNLFQHANENCTANACRMETPKCRFTFLLIFFIIVFRRVPSPSLVSGGFDGIDLEGSC